MTNLKTILYFAYGSNMLTARLQQPTRVPSADPIGSAHVAGFRLQWTKPSTKDCSGKCHIVSTGKSGDVVYGVIFRLPKSDIDKLDRVEGAAGERPGYKRISIRVQTEKGSVDAETYCANQPKASLRPYTWYRALVIAGAKEHGLPADYIAALETQAAVEDPDLERHADEMNVISA